MTDPDETERLRRASRRAVRRALLLVTAAGLALVVVILWIATARPG